MKWKDLSVQTRFPSNTSGTAQYSHFHFRYLTLSQLVCNGGAYWPLLCLRLSDHHGGEGSDKAILKRHLQSLGCGVAFLFFSATSSE